jgi:chromosome segregation ATPase
MRKSDCMKAMLVAVTLCLAAWAGYARDQSSSQQTGDPIADAARKAREEKQKKDAQKPKKVYTDDDIKPAMPDKPEVQNASAGGATTSGTQGATAATGAAATATGATGSQKADGEEKEDPNSEKAWRRRFSEQHRKIADAEKELDVLQRELQKSSVAYYADPTKAMNEQNNRAEISDKNAKIEAKKKELAQLHQQLDDMEADLRKSGGDPGWAR